MMSNVVISEVGRRQLRCYGLKIGQYFENPEQIIWEIEEKFSSYHLPPLGYSSSSREEENGDSTVNH